MPARYGSKRTIEKPLSDGSVITFVLPRENHLNQALAVCMEKNAAIVSALTSRLNDKQIEEYEKQKAANQTQQAAEATAGKTREEKAWARFNGLDHATLVSQCTRAWVNGSDDVVDGDDYEDVPDWLLEEAARAIYAARVEAPKKARKNSSGSSVS